MRQMMSLGDFIFSLSDKTPFSQRTRTSDGGWVTVPRYGQKPLSQNTGAQLERMSISGTWFKSDASINIAKLRTIQRQKVPQVVTDGYGNNLGLWTIKQVQEKQDRLIDDGTAMVTDFTLELEEYGA